MKFLFLCALVVLAFAQEEEDGSALLSRCNDGFIVGENVNMTEVNCDFGDEDAPKACQTKFELKDGELVSIIRVCSSVEACMNNAAQNRPKCWPGVNGVQQCFFCCNTDLCNNFEVLPLEPPTEAGEEDES